MSIHFLKSMFAISFFQYIYDTEIKYANSRCHNIEFHSCHTVKGKGVSFMENNPSWHGNAPKQEQYEIAKAELEAQLAAAERGE